MKRLITFSILLFIATFSYSQEAVSVPEVPIENQWNLARSFLYNTILSSINTAKVEGNTVEKYAFLHGNIYKAAWSEELSFEQFSQTCIYNMVCISGRINSETPSVELTNQSDDKVVFVASDLYPNLYEQGKMLGTTYEELIKYFEVVYNQIAGKYNYSYTMETDENKVIVTISK